jgi:hypothetical protein
MGEQPVAKGLFGFARSPQKTAAPEKSEKADTHAKHHNGHGIIQQIAAIYLHQCQIVYGPFDDAGNEQLEQIHNDQTEQTHTNGEPIGDQVGLYQFK